MYSLPVMPYSRVLIHNIRFRHETAWWRLCYSVVLFVKSFALALSSIESTTENTSLQITEIPPPTTSPGSGSLIISHHPSATNHLTSEYSTRWKIICSLINKSARESRQCRRQCRPPTDVERRRVIRGGTPTNMQIKLPSVFHVVNNIVIGGLHLYMFIFTCTE